MPFLLPLFARVGIPKRFQRLAAWIALGIALIALLSLGKCVYDRKLIADHEAQREAAASAAREQAAEEQAADTLRNARNEKDLHDAINQAPPGDGRISPAAHALACERLRKIGRIPEACRPQGGGGDQARPK